MATTNKGFMQPVIDRNKKIKPTNKFIWTVKTDPSKSPMNQPNNPLTPKPLQKAIKSAKKAVIKAVGKGKGTSVAKAIGAAAKAVVPKKAPEKKATFNLDAEVKKTMSGAYGTGAARKQALGANYSKVQAEINRRAAASKPKTSSPKSTAKPAATPAPEAKSEQIVMKTKKVTEVPTSSSKPSQIITKSGGSGLGAKEKADQDLAKQGLKKGGSVRKMQKGGVMTKPKTTVYKVPGSSPATKEAINNINTKPKPKKMQQGGVKKPTKRIIDSKIKPMGPDRPMPKPPMAKKGGAIKKMMTGGMVNPNAKVSKQTVAGSKGVMSGVNPKASASKYASSKGSGRANTPPSKAVPVAKRGGMIKRRK